MPETQRLLNLARARLSEGRLPGQSSVTTTLGGRSVGAVCGVCGTPVEPGAPEIEIAWSDGDCRHNVLLHPPCHGAWLTASRLDVTEPS